MKEFLSGMFIMTIGWFAGMIVAYDIATEDQIKIIEQCQKDLPRDQYCTIIAVPENEIEE